MKHTISFALLLSISAVASQAQITVTAGDLQNLSSYTTPGNEVTFTPLVGGVATGATFSNHASLIGVTSGSDVSSNSIEADLNEGFEMAFSAGAGLDQIVFKWHRANVEISGFTSDPMATASVDSTDLTGINFNAGTLSFTLDSTRWENPSTINFGDWTASSGATLTLLALDDGGSAPRFSGISVTAVPEPGTMAAWIGGLACVLVLLRRKFRN